MNEQRFIELLNLYVDHQISPEEAAELEAAVLADPRRRRIYDQYCRIQRACSLLCNKGRPAAPAHSAFVRALRDAEQRIAAPRRRPVWRALAFHPAFGAGLAAACVAVVFVLNREPSVTEEGQAQDRPATIAAKPASTPAGIPVLAALPAEFHPALATPGLASSSRNLRESEIVLNDKEALEWMQRVDALPATSRVLADEAFEYHATLHQDNRVFRGRHDLQGTAEFTAFQFQR